jgi:PBP1b-binding outer membrane lipoprotein LpoB
MKSIIVILFSAILFSACIKDRSSLEPLSPKRSNIYVKVEAIHTDGTIVTTNVHTIR